MQLFRIFARRLHKEANQPPIRQGPLPDLDDIFQVAQHTYRSTDPETTSQWRRLKAAMEEQHRREILPHAPERKAFLRPALAFSVAAVLLAIAGILWFQEPAGTETYATARGQHSLVTLPDSTEVTLNHTSTLFVGTWSRGRDRNVSLTGEAFFRVRKTGTPFVVSTDIGRIQVLGTEFNVRARDQRMEVGVVSGRVRVTITAMGKDSAVSLSPGQILSCVSGTFPGAPAALRFSGYPGWIHGRLTFYRTGLPAVCRELESQFDITVRTENPSLQNETITGTLNGQSIDSALSTLCLLTGSRYRHEKNGYTVY